MAEWTYSLYLTERVEGQAHPHEYEPIVSGLDHNTATGICLTLNEGGFLRDGVEAHTVSEPLEEEISQ